VLERLCETVSCSNSSDSSSEEELPCSSPFVPDGSCCATCGARIKIEFNEMMNFDELSKLVYKSVSQDYGFGFKKIRLRIPPTLIIETDKTRIKILVKPHKV
jgi:hypothetical protein